jgi:hypothetical protein
MTGDFTEFIAEDTAVNETLLPMVSFGNVWVARMEAETA